MYIRWKVKPRSKGEQTLLHTAYLAENKRVDGKPRQTVTYLASIQNGQIDNPQHRRHFWQVVEARMKTLDLNQEQITMIRTRLLERVPMAQPVPVQIEVSPIPPVPAYETTASDSPITLVPVLDSQPEPKRRAKQAKKQDEPVFTIANFAQKWQPEYRCEALQGDVFALWILRPYVSQDGTHGLYQVEYLDWQPTTNKRKIPDALRERGISLKMALSDKVLTAMTNAGWIQAGTSDTGKMLCKKTA